jgi:hypothetical protein
VSPETIAKAARLWVIATGAKTWDVQGTDLPHVVRKIGDTFRCDCNAAGGSCSHREAVKLWIIGHDRINVDLDALTVEQLSSMTLGELGHALNKVAVTMNQLAQAQQEANIELADVRIAINRKKLLGEPIVESVNEMIWKKAVCDNLAIRVSALKNLRTSLQTTMRMIGQ